MQLPALGSQRVVFGAGTQAAAAGLLAELGARRVWIVAPSRHADGARQIAAALGERCAGLFCTTEPQVQSELADSATKQAREAGADWLLAHGGGTPIGLAKAIALQLPVSLAAVPTTYAGSERTDIWGLTRDGHKLTGRDERVRPRLVVYDPELLRALDRHVALDSLFNALAHAVEALYASDAEPQARAAAEQSLPWLLEGLEAIGREPSALAACTGALRGAALAGFALGGASMGLHHKLAHVLSGRFGTPHARTHATLLPHVLAFNGPTAPAALGVLARALGSADPPASLHALQRSLGLATSLAALGVERAALASVADEALRERYPNPRPLERAALIALLERAFDDRRPSAPCGG